MSVDQIDEHSADPALVPHGVHRRWRRERWRQKRLARHTLSGCCTRATAARGGFRMSSTESSSSTRSSASVFCVFGVSYRRRWRQGERGRGRVRASAERRPAAAATAGAGRLHKRPRPRRRCGAHEHPSIPQLAHPCEPHAGPFTSATRSCLQSKSDARMYVYSRINSLLYYRTYELEMIS